MNETNNSESETSEKTKTFLNECLSKINPLQILNRVKNLLVAPLATWSEVKQEENSIKDIYIKYLMPVMILSCFAGFLGMQIFGMSIPFFGTHRPPFFSSLVGMIFQIVLGLAAILLNALIISKISPKFDGTSSFDDSFKLIAFAYLPALFAGVLGIIPSLAILAGLVGLYCFYIYFLGVVPMLGVSEDKKIIFTVVSIISIIAVSLILAIIVAMFSPKMPEISTQQAMEQLNPMLDKFADSLGKAGQQ